MYGLLGLGLLLAFVLSTCHSVVAAVIDDVTGIRGETFTAWAFSRCMFRTFGEIGADMEWLGENIGRMEWCC